MPAGRAGSVDMKKSVIKLSVFFVVFLAALVIVSMIDRKSVV